MVDIINLGDRHTSDQIKNITPIEGDLLMDTTKKVLVVGDGYTKGGIPMAQGPIVLVPTGDVNLGVETMIFIDASGGNVDITLPDIALNPNKIYTINRVDSSSNIVTVEGSQTINGEVSQTLSKDDSMVITNNTTEWRII